MNYVLTRLCSALKAVLTGKMSVTTTNVRERCTLCCQQTCTIHNVKKKLPILQWLPHYR